MIKYVCKYTPLEIFAGFHQDCELIDQLADNFDIAGGLAHDNLCGFGKSMLQDVLESGTEELVLVNCCDTMKRIYEVLLKNGRLKFSFLIDLPHRQSCCSAERLAAQFEKMCNAYAEYSGLKFDRQAFINAISEPETSADEGPYIGILGVRCGQELEDQIRSCVPANIRNLTCVRNRRLCMDKTSLAGLNDHDLMQAYALSVLGQFPCGRMGLPEKRRELLSDPNLKGIIYHTIKFCDYYEMEYIRAKNDLSVPILKLETDYTRQSQGQLKTRIEAFAETISGLAAGKNDSAAGKNDLAAAGKNDLAAAGKKNGGADDAVSSNNMASVKGVGKNGGTLYAAGKKASGTQGTSKNAGNLYAAGKNDSGANGIDSGAQASGTLYAAGIDSGSTSTDVVIMDSGKNIIASVIIPTGGGANASADEALLTALSKAGLDRSQISSIVKTGYGRDYIDQGNSSSVTEITCHAKGAHFLCPEARTVIDIGGQDSKAIKIDENGAVVNFVMNDKCAAGTGRFLEMMARTLGMDLSELSNTGIEWKEDIAISSMCTVFAESEIVSLVAQNKAVTDIVHGLNNSVASKVASLAKRVSPEEGYIMTGGVANNNGVVKALEEKLGTKLFISRDAQLCGAIGAALIALEKMN